MPKQKPTTQNSLTKRSNSQPERRSRTTPYHHYHQNSCTIYHMFLVSQVHKLFSASTKPSQSKSMQHCIHGLFFCCNLRWKAQSKVKEQYSKPKFTPKKPFQFTTGQEISRSVVNFDLTIYQILLILIFKCTNLFSLKPHET